MFVNREAIHGVRPGPVVKEGDIWFTRGAGEDGSVYLVIPQGKKLWKRGGRREFTLGSLKAGEGARISVLGQSGKTVEYDPTADPEARLKQTPEGLEISVVRAQRLYNDHAWPNPVVVKLEGVEFVLPEEAVE